MTSISLQQNTEKSKRSVSLSRPFIYFTKATSRLSTAHSFCEVFFTRSVNLSRQPFGVSTTERYIGSLLWLLSILYHESFPLSFKLCFKVPLPYECGTNTLFILSALARTALSMRLRWAVTNSSRHRSSKRSAFKRGSCTAVAGISPS